MTTNRLAKSERVSLKMSKQEWADRGNAYLFEIGRADELEWFVTKAGELRIGYRRDTHIARLAA